MKYIQLLLILQFLTQDLISQNANMEFAIGPTSYTVIKNNGIRKEHVYQYQTEMGNKPDSFLRKIFIDDFAGLYNNVNVLQQISVLVFYFSFNIVLRINRCETNK